MPRVRVGATASKGMDAEWAECDTFLLRFCGCRNRWPDVARVPGWENPADPGTKHLAQREMHECMRRADCQIAGGRSRLVLRLRRTLS